MFLYIVDELIWLNFIWIDKHWSDVGLSLINKSAENKTSIVAYDIYTATWCKVYFSACKRDIKIWFFCQSYYANVRLYSMRYAILIT